MNDTAIKNFCIWAHNELADQVEVRAQRFLITEEGADRTGVIAVEGVPLSPVDQRQRADLINVQREIGHEALIERAAYTWFNRMAAIRYMELHDYLPSHVRLFSADDGSFAPQALACALDVSIEGADEEQIASLISAGNDEQLFRYLFLAQCNELSACIPGVFEPIDNAMELLLPDRLLRKDGVIARLVEDIPESDWEQVEILGWMYQYYNAQAKEDFFKSKRKASARDIAPATQLFTPEWIVRYMVENSLGRLWMLNFPESKLADGWDYYIAPDEQHEDFIRISSPEDITLCDPACGSGHILVYAFQLLFSMYVERGYREREIPQLILQKNLAGMEIDPRAAQIASLALAMCAREHDRRFFGRGVQADICVVKPAKFDRDGEGNVVELPQDAQVLAHPQLIDALDHLDEIGSLFCPSELELQALRADAERFGQEGAGSDLFGQKLGQKLQGALEVCEALVRRFACVVANPPYMGSSSFSPFMSKWIKKNYPDVKSDLCTCFIERIMDMCTKSGLAGITTSNSWMFLSSFEQLRSSIVNSHTIETLVQLSVHGFHGIAAQVCTFVLRNSYSEGYLGAYIRLNDFDHWSLQEGKTREAITNPDCGWFYRRNAKTFTQIPGTPIAYWVSQSLVDSFSKGLSLGETTETHLGMATCDNERFLRLWWEVAMEKRGVPELYPYDRALTRWVPYCKGGIYRKWYGNDEFVVDWEDDGERLDAAGAVMTKEDLWFKEMFSWTRVSSGSLAVRLKRPGYMFDMTGPAGFGDSKSINYNCAFLNSAIGKLVAKFLSASLDFQPGQIASYPVIADPKKVDSVCGIVDELTISSKLDWDSFETSWDFKRHPLV